MEDPLTNWEEYTREIQQDRRRGKRLNLTFLIEIRGFSQTGSELVEHVETTDISEDGCRFKTQLPLRRRDVISIKLLGPRGTNLPERKSQLFEVIWVARHATGNTVGARKLESGKVWAVAFPPANRSSETPSK